MSKEILQLQKIKEKIIIYNFLTILYMILGALNIGISALRTDVIQSIIGLAILCFALLMGQKFNYWGTKYYIFKYIK